ncbi:FadR/GntR family transcriptional regulator [Mycolicibacterium alvei]
MLIGGEIAEGTMLPPEPALMEHYGVSRPTLREAFRVLESESLIQMCRGRSGGARVTRPRRETLARYAGLILEYEGVTVKDVCDARAALEVPMVQHLTMNRDPRVITELERIVDREVQMNPGASDQLSDFHAAIARLSGNDTLQIISHMLRHIIEKTNRSMQSAKGKRLEQAVRRSVKTHRMVLNAIRAGDVAEAGELWRRHVQNGDEFVLTASEMSAAVDLLE